MADTAATSPMLPSKPLLYRDTLQSVLAFLPLGGLAASLRVSPDWAATVRAMPSAGVPYDLPGLDPHPPGLDPLLKSPALARHVGQLSSLPHERHSIKAENVTVLAQRCPHLHTLFLWIRFPPRGVAVSLPASLRTLDVYFGMERGWALKRDQTELLRAISALQQLRSLRLRPVHESVSLAPLRQLPLLRELHLFNMATCSKTTAADLRALTQLHDLRLEADGMESWFPALLATPVQQLQWRSLSFGTRDPRDHLAPLLCALPALERLDLRVTQLSAFVWLAAMPALRHLSLTLWNLDDAQWAELLTVFTSGGLARLCSLTLKYGPCSSADLAQLLPRLPQLERLELHSLERVDTLAFLELPSLARSLTHLTLHGSSRHQFKSAHLPSLLGLQQLQELHLLQWAKDAPDALTAEQRAAFKERPCRVLPQLRVFKWTPCV